MLVIDGSFGEGGGQILRSSLALSIMTGIPFRLNHIRAGRNKPGLLRQHLTCVMAAKEISDAEVEGAEIRSQEMLFKPSSVRSGRFHFSVGSAGSALLVLQTILPPLMVAEGESDIVLEGGTHNPWAPPFDAIEKSFLPIINKLGPCIEAHCERLGFYPLGGGRVLVKIKPAKILKPMEIVERGQLKTIVGEMIYSQLDHDVVEREANELQKRLGTYPLENQFRRVKNSLSAGNVISLSLYSENHTEVITGFGKKGLSAEKVARAAAKEAVSYLAADVPVGEYLADQLLIPMALANQGVMRTVAPSMHTKTNIEVIEKFMDVSFCMNEVSQNQWEIKIK